MSSKKITITIPNDLAQRLEPWRDRMNISKVCTEAITAEIEMLEAHLGQRLEITEHKGK